MSLRLEWQTNSLQHWSGQINHNGTSVAQQYLIGSTAGASAVTNAFTQHITMVAGDTIAAYANHGSGASPPPSANLAQGHTQLQITRIR
ncbi:MAG: hypothetical protein AB7O52_17745 [Planctomycetota bacterium]